MNIDSLIAFSWLIAQCPAQTTRLKRIFNVYGLWVEKASFAVWPQGGSTDHAILASWWYCYAKEPCHGDATWIWWPQHPLRNVILTWPIRNHGSNVFEEMWLSILGVYIFLYYITSKLSPECWNVLVTFLYCLPNLSYIYLYLRKSSLSSGYEGRPVNDLFRSEDCIRILFLNR
jgi:hypothetical protein